MFNKVLVALLTTSLLASSLYARKNAPDASQMEILPRDLEIDLALSAAPKHLRKDAGVYVLAVDGYVKVRESKNGFNCLVARPDFGIQPGAFEPNCYGPEASRTILPAVIANAKYRAQRLSLAELDQKMQQGYEDGTFRRPERPGIVYMLSPANRVALSSEKYMVSGDVGILPAVPHLMFFGHNVNREELGLLAFRDKERPAWLPVLTAQNTNWAYIVTFLGKEGEEEVWNDPHNVKLMKDMKKYLEKSQEFMLGAK